jgi:hypothetical protein
MATPPNYCINRQLFLNYTSVIPKIRNEIQSPYPQYTQEQLNMRRKAEILKYNNTQSNRLTNSLTKKQKWSNLNQQPTRVQNLVSCPKRIIPTPTSSSDVPGPVIYLLEDDSVPLYNYVNQADKRLPLAPIANTSLVPFISTSAGTDIQSSNNNPFTVGSLTIVNPLNYVGSFEMQVPLSIQIAGSINVSTNQIVSIIQLQFTTISCTVFYFDASMAVYQSADTSTLENTVMVVNVQYSDFGDFSASQYIGNLIVSNIALNTQSGYIYNFSIQCSIEYTFLDQNGASIASPNYDVSGIQVYTISNLTDTSDPFYLYSNNCEVLSSPDYLPFSPFSITQI